MIGGVCQDVLDDSLCEGFGEGIFLTTRGEPSCQCWEGWGRKGRRDEERMVVWGGGEVEKQRSGGRCYQEYTQGFCNNNMVIKFMEGIFGCINNPCGENQLPH